MAGWGPSGSVAAAVSVTLNTGAVMFAGVAEGPAVKTGAWFPGVKAPSATSA